MRHIEGHRYDRRARAVALSAMAVGSAGHGAAYLTSGGRGIAHLGLVDTLVPLRVWAVVWLVSAVGLTLGLRFPRIARWSMSLAVSLWGVWCLSYLGAWVLLDVDRAWVTAIPLGALCLGAAVLTILMEPPEREEGQR